MDDGPQAGDEHGGSRPHRAALLRYALVWLAAALGVVGPTLLVLDDGDQADVSLPPVQQTELADAAKAAGCELGDGMGVRSPSPVTGPRARPAKPGIYTRALKRSEVLTAVRRGIIVIQYRRSIGGKVIETLETVQRVAPAGTIVAPAADRPDAITVTAWRHLLACRRFNAATLDAVRLFRGRFIGTGPDTGQAVGTARAR